MNFEGITEEQKAKAKACTTSEELIALAKEEGLDLTDADLDAISGGWKVCSNKVCDTLFMEPL